MNPRVFSVCSGLPQVVHPNPGTAGELGPGTSRPPGTFGSGISPDSGRAGKEPANDHTLSLMMMMMMVMMMVIPGTGLGMRHLRELYRYRFVLQSSQIAFRSSQIGSGKNQKS